MNNARIPPLKVTWVANRMIATIPDAAAFERDLMACWARTREANDLLYSGMYGAFSTTTRKPTKFSEHEALLESMGLPWGAPADMNNYVYGAHDWSVNAVQFASHLQPVYDQE